MGWGVDIKLLAIVLAISTVFSFLAIAVTY